MLYEYIDSLYHLFFWECGEMRNLCSDSNADLHDSTQYRMGNILVVAELANAREV